MPKRIELWYRRQPPRMQAALILASVPICLPILALLDAGKWCFDIGVDIGAQMRVLIRGRW